MTELAPSQTLARFWLGACVALLAFLSYQQNFFHVVSRHWFEVHGLFGENLVLDGLQHSDDQPSRTMGIYTDQRVDEARADYTANRRGASYKPYDSFYGLQSHLFGAMRDAGYGSVAAMEGVVAALTSLVLAWIAVMLARQYGMGISVVTSAIFILSPWWVVFARNLYWVPCVWLLPIAVSLHYAARNYTQRRSLYLMLGGLFVTFLLRFLCGYDYAPTLVFACFVPVVYAGLMRGVAPRIVLRNIALVGLAAVAGFVVAVAIHAQALETRGVAGTEKVWITAQKRLYAISDTPQAIAAEICNGDAECMHWLVASLTSNPLKVTAGYFMFPYVLPWTPNVMLADADRAALKDFVAGEKTVTRAKHMLGALAAESWLYLILKIVNPLCFFLFLGALGLSLRNAPRAARMAALCALLAPLSWYVIAKGHSYIHTHLNYVLWYLPFVPTAAAFMLRWPPRFRKE